MSSLSRSRASLHFNPRTPRGVRPVPSPTGWASLKFQSTHPARGATPHVGQRPVQQAISIHAPREGCDAPPHGSKSARGHFNPRTPRGVRRYLTATLDAQTSISIHAPREGCDESACGCSRPGGRFQSTHPARGATDFRLASDRAVYISIHAPREGCDVAFVSP